MKKKISLTKFELVWYSVCAAFALWGLTYIVLGLVAQYANLPDSANLVRSASEDFAEIFGLGFFGWGLILLSLACAAAVIVLLIFAKNTDKEFEKASRRAARLGAEEKVVAEVNPEQQN